MSREPIYRGKICEKDLVVFERVTRDMNPEDAGICHRRGGRFFVSVRPGLPPRKRLEVIIHEILHAADWTKDEEWVEETGIGIAFALFAIGYRADD